MVTWRHPARCRVSSPRFPAAPTDEASMLVPYMSRLVIAVAIALPPRAVCAQRPEPPPEANAKQALQDLIDKGSAVRFELTTFTKADGIMSEVGRVWGYRLEFKAEGRFLADVWYEGPDRLLTYTLTTWPADLRESQSRS